MSVAPSPNGKPNRCGDGRIDLEREGCDDGNLKNGDGCSASCRIEGPTAPAVGAH